MGRWVCVWLAALLAACALWAGDPWKDKEPKDWTLEDVKRILTDSPWVRNQDVSADWIHGGSSYLQMTTGSCEGQPDLSKPPRTPGQWYTGTPRVPVVAFEIFWQSARIIRTARHHLQLLCGSASGSPADEELLPEIGSYIVLVQAPNMAPFEGLSEGELRQSAWLTPKKLGRKVSPVRIQITTGRDRKTVYRLEFHFPKKTESGEPIIAADEKEVEFACQGGKLTLKTKFQPQRMVGRAGADL
jgi:hypothetical protein